MSHNIRSFKIMVASIVFPSTRMLLFGSFGLFFDFLITIVTQSEIHTGSPLFCLEYNLFYFAENSKTKSLLNSSIKTELAPNKCGFFNELHKCNMFIVAFYWMKTHISIGACGFECMECNICWVVEFPWRNRIVAMNREKHGFGKM